MPNSAHLPEPAAPIIKALALWLLILAAVLAPADTVRADAESDWRAGFAAGGRGNYELALRYYSRVIHAGWLPPDEMAQVFYNRATAYLRLGDLDWAIQDYSVAIWLRPDFADAYYNRGLAYRQNGDRQLADDDLARALVLSQPAPIPIVPIVPIVPIDPIDTPTETAPETQIVSPVEPATETPSAEPRAAAPRTLALTAPPPPRASPSATVSAGAYALHVASFRTEAAVRREWRRLERRLPDLLGDMAITVRRVTLPGRGVYHRLLVGAFADRAAAAKACLPFKAEQQTCRPLPIQPGDGDGASGE